MIVVASVVVINAAIRNGNTIMHQPICLTSSQRDCNQNNVDAVVTSVQGKDGLLHYIGHDGTLSIVRQPGVTHHNKTVACNMFFSTLLEVQIIVVRCQISSAVGHLVFNEELVSTVWREG